MRNEPRASLRHFQTAATIKRMNVAIHTGDCLDVLRTLPDESVHCCVTSPPYWGLRDYGVAGQFGLEKTPDEYVAAMVAVFAEVRRVLRDDGTLWLNLGDSYAGGGNYRGVNSEDSLTSKQASNRGAKGLSQALGSAGKDSGVAPKNLIGIPWRVAFALQADGWYLRSDIIWHKPNPMPESVTDRPTKAHEYLFLFSKAPKYYYDAEAIMEESIYGDHHAKYQGTYARHKIVAMQNNGALNGDQYQEGLRRPAVNPMHRNRRSVWTVPTSPYSEAHFATFPPDLIKPCILAGCPVGGTVLDPFGGSGTTGMVALELGRSAVLIELNPEYVKLAERRCDVTPGLALA